MDKRFHKVGDKWYTDYELKKKILTYKNPELDEKLPVCDSCCICLRNINSWFHGQGRTCSDECHYIFNMIFTSKGRQFLKRDTAALKSI